MKQNFCGGKRTTHRSSDVQQEEEPCVYSSTCRSPSEIRARTFAFYKNAYLCSSANRSAVRCCTEQYYFLSSRNTSSRGSFFLHKPLESLRSTPPSTSVLSRLCPVRMRGTAVTAASPCYTFLSHSSPSGLCYVQILFSANRSAVLPHRPVFPLSSRNTTSRLELVVHVRM